MITSQPGKQTIAIHILTNFSRSKDYRAMNCGQLIEHNMRNIFSEKSYIKCGGETISRPFSKRIEIEHMSRSIVKSFKQCAFIECQVLDYGVTHKGCPHIFSDFWLSPPVLICPYLADPLLVFRADANFECDSNFFIKNPSPNNHLH